VYCTEQQGAIATAVKGLCREQRTRLLHHVKQAGVHPAAAAAAAAAATFNTF
jgi:hypothetical protein